VLRHGDATTLQADAATWAGRGRFAAELTAALEPLVGGCGLRIISEFGWLIERTPALGR